MNLVENADLGETGGLTMTSQTPKDSPSLPDTPFKAFLESPVSKQVSKFQEIAKEYSRKTLGKCCKCRLAQMDNFPGLTVIAFQFFSDKA